MTIRKPTTTPPRMAREPIQVVNVNFPRDLLARIDREAARMGVPRTAWIKLRLADVLDRESQG